MGMIMIRCPATGRGVTTGIEVCATDQLPVVTATTRCPACGRLHKWTKNEAWLANASEHYRAVPRTGWRRARTGTREQRNRIAR